MRRSKPLALIAGAALLTVAACGGSGGGSGSNSGDQPAFEDADTSVPKDPNRQGPAPEVEGATTGGTITVYLPGDPGPDSMDPTDGWSVTGNSTQQALVNRALTQYARDPETGEMQLVPDLAEDLGTPNDDFTEWTFTVREGAKWETGDPVTAEEVAWGITRSMDTETFPAGPGQAYSVEYFKGGANYKGPYSQPNKKFKGVTFDNDARTVTLKMSKPFPDMDYWGAFMAMGPIPIQDSEPPNYGKRPLATGPYKIEKWVPNKELVLVKNEQWDPATDPARHQYADSWVFKYNQDAAKVDEIMLSGNSDSEAAISTQVSAENYSKASETLGDRLVQQSAQCTSFTAPDYGKITDINVRKAIAYGIPYDAVWTASGEIPGVTRVPANSVMPPGMAGKHEYFADGEQFSFQPEKAQQLLADAGYEPGEMKLTMVYYEVDPLAVASQKQLTKGLEEAGFSVKAIPVQVSPYNIWQDPDNKINKQLNYRGVNWCSDWPSGSTMVPPLLKSDQAYNTAFFSEPEIDDEMDNIATLPLDQQADAWGALDEKIGTEYLPLIPTAFRNDLFTFGAKIGNPTGDGALGAPNYKDLYVMQ